jgi:hypothetical protein
MWLMWLMWLDVVDAVDVVDVVDVVDEVDEMERTIALLMNLPLSLHVSLLISYHLSLSSLALSSLTALHRHVLDVSALSRRAICTCGAQHVITDR